MVDNTQIQKHGLLVQFTINPHLWILVTKLILHKILIAHTDYRTYFIGKNIIYFQTNCGTLGP